MDNKKYLDKVIGSLVRGTRINYEKKRIYFSFFSYNSLFTYILHNKSVPSIHYSYSSLLSKFSKYCKNTFGLTEDEIDYVWKEYVEIMKNKINNGEQ